MSRYQKFINENINNRNYVREDIQRVADIIHAFINDRMVEDLGLNPPALIKASYVLRPKNISEDMGIFVTSALNLLESTNSTDVSYSSVYKNKAVEIMHRLQQLDAQDDEEQRFVDSLNKVLLKITSSPSNSTRRKYTHHLERLLSTMK